MSNVISSSSTHGPAQLSTSNAACAGSSPAIVVRARPHANRPPSTTVRRHADQRMSRVTVVMAHHLTVAQHDFTHLGVRLLRLPSEVPYSDRVTAHMRDLESAPAVQHSSRAPPICPVRSAQAAAQKPRARPQPATAQGRRPQPPMAGPRSGCEYPQRPQEPGIPEHPHG